jgi:hypothetical protein
MKVVIDGKVYDGRTIDSLTIKHALQFNRECEAGGYGVNWADVERVRAEVIDLGEESGAKHPQALLLTAVSVWATLVAAGEEVTFESVISRPLGQMTFIVDKPAEPAPESPDPQRARPASGRAAAPRAKAKAKARPKQT